MLGQLIKQFLEYKEIDRKKNLARFFRILLLASFLYRWRAYTTNFKIQKQFC